MIERQNILKGFDRLTNIQFVRYVLIGVGSNFALFMAYILITRSGVGHKTAMTLLYVSGTCLTFVFNKNWTFEYKGSTKIAFPGYVLIYVFGYLINLAVLYCLVDKLNYDHHWVQGAMIFILAILLFLLQKFLVFRKT